MADKFDFENDVYHDPIKTASEVADDKLKTTFKKLSKWRSVLAFIIMVAITAVLPLSTFHAVDPFSFEFCINAVYSLLTATLSYYIFAPFGKRSERLESETYRPTAERWAAMSDTVRNMGLIEKFYKFCIIRREEERRERKELYIAAASIPKKIYEMRYSKLSVSELREKRAIKEITKKQFKYIKAANSEIKIEPINPSMILSGLKFANINDVGRARRKNILGAIKPITLIITIVARGIIEVGVNSNISVLEYVTQLATSLSIILMWSFAGFKYGVSMVRDEEQLMNGRSEFISMFLERARDPYFVWDDSADETAPVIPNQPIYYSVGNIPPANGYVRPNVVYQT